MIEMPIAEYFALGNQEKFRDLEYQILMEMAQYIRVVISTGGGIVERNTNWGILRHGLVVFLDMSPEDIYTRLSVDKEQIMKRPLLQGDDPLEKLKKLSADRRDKYLQADLTISVNPDSKPDEIAVTTAKSILQFIVDNPPLWAKWKAERDGQAVEAAARMNPAATAAADVGFGTGKKGSIEFVSIQDIQSGKVKLPSGVALPKSEDEKEREKKGNFGVNDGI